MLEILIYLNSITINFKTPAKRNPSDFAYINYVHKDPYENPNIDGSFPYLDPPIGGWALGKADHKPYYYDEDCDYCEPHFDIKKHTNDERISFFDAPHEPRLLGDQTVEFETCLVDRTQNDAEIECVFWFLGSDNKVSIRNF
jgi:hypothetical protein